MSGKLPPHRALRRHPLVGRPATLMSVVVALLALMSGAALAQTADFGDYTSFPSASSTVVTTLKIGATTDKESAATTNATATGDDITGTDDEDGVTVPASIAAGSASSLTVNVTNTTGSTVYLNVWIDYNNNGVLTDSGEQIAANTTIATGTSNSNRTVSFTVPATATLGSVGVRVRLTSTSSPGPDGLDGNGEVEDHSLTITTAPTLGVGNLVWTDSNDNGRFDTGEGVSGVLVQLLNTSNTVVTSTTTDAAGLYQLTTTIPGTYYAKIPASEFASGEPLAGKYSRVGNGPDNGKDDDWDENGVDDAAPATNGIRSPNFTLTAGAEPTTGETGTDSSWDNGTAGRPSDANADLTIDFGFAICVQTNLITNGSFETANPTTLTFPDVFPTGGSAIAKTRTTASNADVANWSFDAGSYIHDPTHTTDGSRMVHLNSSGACAGQQFAVGSVISGLTQLAAGQVYTLSFDWAPFDPSAPNTPPAGNNTQIYTDFYYTNSGWTTSTFINSFADFYDTKTNDFLTNPRPLSTWASLDWRRCRYKFVLPPAPSGQNYLTLFLTAGGTTGKLLVDNVTLTVSCEQAVGSVGNLIFNDANGNRVKDATESGIDKALVHLYRRPATGSPVWVGSTYTSQGGRYLFSGMQPANYYVWVDSANFSATTPSWWQGGSIAGPLYNKLSSSSNANPNVTAATASDDDVSEKGVDNAAPITNGIYSSDFALGVGTEPVSSVGGKETGAFNSLDDSVDSHGDMTIDFGFAPATAAADYGDYSLFPLASSTANSALRIGSVATDSETIPTTNDTATGDDTTGTDDEDGVTVPASMLQGASGTLTVNVTNSSGATAYLNVWIDFNDNGLLTDSGEQIAVNTTVATGTSNSNRTVNFTVPASAVPGKSGVRVRLTSTSSPGPDGLDGNGEVEDTTLFVGCIFPSNLTLGKLSSAYSQFATFSAPGMTAPITWSATGLPAGLVMDSAAARITGTPTGSAGAFPITVTAVDAASVSLTRSYTFFIEDSAVNLLTNGDFESGSTWTPTRLKLSSTTNNSMDVLTTGNPLTGMGSAMASNLLPDNSVFWLQTGTGKALTGNKYVLIRGNDNCVQLTDPALSGSSSVLVPGSSYKITAFVANTEATSGYLDFEMVDGSSSTVQTQKFTLPVPASNLSENAANCLELPWAEYGWTFTPPPAWNPANVVFYVSPQTIGSNVPGLVIDHWRVVRLTSLDFGDFSGFADASSSSLYKLRLGATVDAETAATTNATATGDDTNVGDDEDGVTMPASISLSSSVTIPVSVFNNTGSNAYLHAWIDFNNDGTLNDTLVTSGGERLETARAITTGTGVSTQNITFTVPASASSGTQRGARFRLTNQAVTTPTGEVGSGEVEDYVVTIAATQDFGDYAPFPSASSTGNATLRIGATMDVEGSATTNATATGDDTTGSDDEDGVTIPASITQGTGTSMTVNVTNTSGTSAYLNVWIDFNGNGVLTDSGEQVATNTAVATATSNSNKTVSFTVPAEVKTGTVGVRARLTSISSPGPDGLDGIGEVEDVTTSIVANTDFGDYASFTSASSKSNGTLRLGALVDSEGSSVTNATATGDDLDGTDDEDGVTVPASIAQGAAGSLSLNLTNTTGSVGYLNAWIDFNRNGVLTDAGEQVAVNTNIATGTSNASLSINFTAPVAASLGTAGVRVRLTSVTTPGPDGLDGNGEVEDYATQIIAPTTDFGDELDFADASSTANNTLRLGALVDVEGSSTRNTGATGDDTTTSDDEDGLTFPSVTAGQPVTLPVTVTNTTGTAGFLNVWIDYNNNGSLTDVGEQVATNVSVATATTNGTINLNFTIPTNAVTAATSLGSRFRITDVASPGPTGFAGVGEVEDHPVVILAPLTDFGDFSGAGDVSNTASTNLRLGALVDTEYASTRNAAATGDDTAGSDDEDGVVLPAMTAGQTVTIPVTITNTTGANGYINAWIDYNNNGVLTDSGEQIATNVLVATGASNVVSNLTVNVPATAVTGVSLGARFRFSAPSGLGPTGSNALAGEIEDYVLTIAAPTTDFGDFSGLGSASSTANALIKLGALTDTEFTATTNATATGDDITGSDDEDAVSFPIMTVGAAATIPVVVTNTSGAAVFLNAWIDYNNNGVLTDSGEQIATNVSIANGSSGITQNLSINIPAGATVGLNLGARFRLTSGSTPGATGASGNGEVEDYTVSIASPTTDFGDFSGFASASNSANSTLRLGTLVDSEVAATTNATATGDDITGSDDENGVTLPAMTAGQTYTVPVVVTNTTGAGAFLNAWIDLNNDGDLLDAGEQFMNNVAIATGSNGITSNGSLTIPLTAVTGVNVGLRFRLTSTSSPGATGALGSFGEIEDYVLNITSPPTDFGDFAGFGSASSTRNATLKLGALTDIEPSAITNATATGDDITGSDDEDAVTIPALMAGAPATIQVRVTNSSGSTGRLNAWVDYNNNGVLTDAGEQIATNVSIANGSNNVTRNLSVTVPAAAVTGVNLGARFRLTSTSTPGATGASGTGEVEDYVVNIAAPTLDYGDSSVLGSVASSANGNLRLGALVDTEYTPTMNTTASGDDTTGSDDEDGVTLPTMTAGAPAVIPVVVTNNTGADAFLNAWIDFNNDGDVADVGEQLATNTSVVTGTSNGTINLNFTVPAAASTGTTVPLRFRLTSTSSPGITGTSGNGEAEDYITTIAVPATDFGDWNGAEDASSIASSNLRMGALADTEYVSTLNAAASGDDATGSDDEDGVTLSAGYNLGAASSLTVVVTNLTGASGYLNVWVDWNNNGSFTDAGEQIATNTSLATGMNAVAQTVNFTVPAGAIPGLRGVRARLTNVQNPTSLGAAGIGEVEDYLLTVNCPTLTITPTTLPGGTVNAAYSQTLTASGGSASYTFSVSAGSLPAGLTLSSAGLLSGTPTSSSATSFTIRATDVNGCAGTRAYTVTPSCAAISITPTSTANGTQGTAFSQTLTASGGTAPYASWTVITGTLPGGLTLNAGTGVISGTPTSSNGAGGNVTVRVTDAAGCQGSQVISIKICPVLAISPSTLTAPAIGNAYSQTLTTSGGAAAYSYVISSGSLPAWATLSSAGVLSGTPTSVTSSTFIVRVTDANGCTGTRAYTLTVASLTIGNLVWHDVDNDGFKDAAEPGVPGVAVELLTPGTDNLVGGSGLNADTVIASTTTDATGNYAFSNLVAGRYFVRIQPPANLPLASVVVDTADNGQDDDSNGSQTGGPGGYITSPVVQMAVNTEPGSAGSTSAETTIDFGITPGNSVIWLIDEDHTLSTALHLWSFDNYRSPSTTAHDYGRLKYRRPSDGAIRDIVDGGDIESMAINRFTGDAYILSSDKIAGAPSETQSLWTYNLNDAAENVGNIVLTLIGHVHRPTNGAPIESLAYDPVSKRFYMGDPKDNSQNSSTSTDRLCYLDIRTLNSNVMLATNVTIVGDMTGLSNTCRYTDGLEFSVDGKLYCVDGVDDDVYELSSSTGAIIAISDSDIGGGPGGSVDVETMAWDEVASRMIASENAGQRFIDVTLGSNGANIGIASFVSGVPGMPSSADLEASAMYDTYPPRPKGGIGNVIFNDVNANGRFDAGEGVDGVTVELYEEGDVVGTVAPAATTTTAGGGLYLFTRLLMETYFIHLPASNFAAGAPLHGMVSVPGTAAGDDNVGEDGVDDASPEVNGIDSAALTLTDNGQPTDADSETGFHNTDDNLEDDNNTDLTYDFGFRLSLDFGDLPDTSSGTGTGNYQTFFSNNGPRHAVIPGLMLGTAVDEEQNATANSSATGDDVTNGDDEDALTAAPVFYAGTTSTLPVRATNTTTTAATLHVWVDFNNNGSFEDSGEKQSTVAVPTGSNNAIFNAPVTVPVSVPGVSVGVRLRLSWSGSLTSLGLDTSGEVEDYLATFDTCPTLTIGPALPAAAAVGTAYSQTLIASGTQVAVGQWTVISGTLPAGLALNANTGVISGTPTTANGAGVNVTVRVTDANGCQGTQVITLKVCPVITLSPASLINGTVSTAYSQTITAAGGTAPYNFTVASGALPGWATLNATTGIIAGTPNSTSASAFTIRATDANGCTGTRAYSVTPVCSVLTINPTTLPNGTVGTAYSQTLTGSGGVAPYSAWTITSGALPVGLTLNATSGVISGTSTSNAAATFTVRASDANACQGSRSYTITPACPSILVVPFALPAATVGVAYSQTLSPSGGIAPYSSFTVTAGSFPAGLTLSSAGVLSGTATAANGAGTSVTLRVTDANGCQGTQTITFKVCPIITLSPSSPATATVGTAYSQSVTASGGAAAYVYAISSGALPAWATLNTSTGVISGTPNSAATANFTVRATDANGCQGTVAYTLTPVCPAMSVTTASLNFGTVGSVYSQTLSGTGGSTPYTWAVSAGTLPAGLTLSSGGVISGTPTTSNGSGVSLTMRVTDSYGCQTTRSYTLKICPVIALTPVTLPDGVAGTGYSQTVTASGGATPYVFALSVGALPPGLALSSGGVISGTPTSNVSANFTISATDANGCIGTRAYTLAVGCPTMSITPATLPAGLVGTAYSQTLTATGGTSPYTWIVSAGTLPAGLALNSAGLLSGTPTTSNAAGVSVTIRATDATSCAVTRSFTLQVCPLITVNPASLINGTVGTAYSQTITATGGAAAYTFSVVSGALPAWATLNASTGAITGTPTSTTSASFTVRASDANACTGTRAYTITPVCPTITISPASLTRGTVGSGYNQTLTASGGVGPYSAWTVTSGALPAGLTLNSGTGVITGTPTSSNGAGGSFTVRVTDTYGCQGTQTVSLQICPVIAITPTTLPAPTIGTAYSQTITATGGATPYVFSISAGALPAWATLNASTGVISGMPNNATSAAFSVRATDANGCLGTRAYSITPACPAIGITPAAHTAYISTAYSQSLTASGGTAPYTWAITSGALPSGFTLNSAGLFSGTSATASSTTVTVRATDTFGCQGFQVVTLTVKGMTIGNRIWQDDNNNGALDPGELGVAGAIVQLMNPGSDNAIGGSAGAADVQVGALFTTDATGAYSFTNLMPGSYYIRVVQPASFTSSGGTPSTADDNADNNNDGAQPGGPGTPLFSPVIQLTQGSESITDGDTDPDTNLTVDFGLWASMAVGNVVFLDINGDGFRNEGESLGNVYVELYAQGDTPGVSSPAGVGSSGCNCKGRYYIEGLNPGNYFLHVPATQFGPGMPLEDLFPLATVVTGDDDVGQDLLFNNDPATNGASSAVFSLRPGQAPVGIAETGGDGVSDDDNDGNVDLTRDLGFAAAGGSGFPLADRVRRSIQNPELLFTTEIVTAAASTPTPADEVAQTTYASWLEAHPGSEDHDFYANLLEYALDTDPDSGASGAGKFRLIVNETTGAADVLLSRPTTGREDISYNVEVSADAKTWTRLTTTTLTSIATDGSQNVRYPAIEDATVFAGQTRGFVRLKIVLDADLNGTPEDTAVTPVQAFSRELFSIGTRSFSMPLVNAEIFAGEVSPGTGSTIILPVAVPLPEAQFYIQDLSSGVIYEVDELASTSTRIAIAAESLLAFESFPSSARIVLRTHHTLAELLPSDLFTAGTSDADADRFMTFDAEANTFRVAWLSANGWTRDGTDASAESLPPQSAVLVHARSAEVSLLLVGQIAASASLKPESSTRFISTGLTHALSPVEAGLTVTKGFRAATSADAASRLRLWKADSEADASGYDSLFFLQTDDAAIWTRQDDDTKADLSKESLLQPFHGFFLVP